MAQTEAARAEAFAKQADRSRELAAGYVQQALANSNAVRQIKAAVDLALAGISIPHRWSGTVLELLSPNGEWASGPDLRGLRGMGIASATVDESSHLVLTFEDGEVVDAGLLQPGNDGADGVSVTSATVDGAGHLILGLSEGGPIDAGRVTGDDGADGRSVVSADIIDGNLIFTYSDNATEDLGDISGPPGRNITGMTIDGSGHLIVTYSSGTSPVDLGKVTGENGSGSGTVTSVGLSMPADFSVASSPVTSAGALTVSRAAGYEAYTTAEKTKLGGLDSALDAKMDKAGGTFTGPVTLAGDPTSALHPATKQFVEGLLANVGKRDRVRAATTANITIGTALNNGDVLDGVTLANGDLVLVKNQTTASQNGVYVVAATPVRSSEFDTWDELPGSLIAVAEGTANGDTLWLCTSNAGGTLGTTALAFSQLRVAGELLAANNLSDVANAATAFGNIKQAASTTATGVLEVATTAEARSSATGDKALVAQSIEDACAKVTLTDAATVAVDWDAFIVGEVALTANRTIGNPTNVQVGTIRTLIIRSSTTTARTPAWGSNYKGIPTDSVTSTSVLFVTLFAYSATQIVCSSRKVDI